MSEEFRTRVLVEAYCQDCHKVWDSPNAHGLGVQHARRRGHYVSVTRTITYVYNHSGFGESEEKTEAEQ